MATVHERATNVRLLVLDVDGVLTDGTLYFGAQGEALKRFHVRDGAGIKLALQSGIELAVVSGRSFAGTPKRMSELGVDTIVQGVTGQSNRDRTNVWQRRTWAGRTSQSSVTIPLTFQLWSAQAWRWPLPTPTQTLSPLRTTSRHWAADRAPCARFATCWSGTASTNVPQPSHNTRASSCSLPRRLAVGG